MDDRTSPAMPLPLIPGRILYVWLNDGFFGCGDCVSRMVIELLSLVEFVANEDRIEVMLPLDLESSSRLTNLGMWWIVALLPAVVAISKAILLICLYDFITMELFAALLRRRLLLLSNEEISTMMSCDDDTIDVGLLQNLQLELEDYERVQLVESASRALCSF